MSIEPTPSSASSVLSLSESKKFESTLSGVSLIQHLLTYYGFPKLNDFIQAAEQKEQTKNQKFLSTFYDFIQTPNAQNRDLLVTFLEQEKTVIKKHYKDIIKKRNFYQKKAELTSSKIHSSRGLTGIVQGMTQSIRNFFGSTEAQQVEKYEKIAQQNLAHQNAIQKYLSYLKTMNLTDTVWLPLDKTTDKFLAESSEPSFPASISLKDMDSKTGFMIDPESVGDGIGFAISSGDVDGDGSSDLLLGAPSRNGDIGSAYVVRGSSDLGKEPILTLKPSTQITRLDGENPQGQSTGASVKIAQDSKNTSHSFILIGSPGYYGYTGSVYLIPGGSQLNQLGSTWSLSNINGTGIQFIGENFDDFAGLSVGVTRHIDGDDDLNFLIGSTGYNQSRGAGYAIKSSHLDQNPVLLGSLNPSIGYSFRFNGINAQLGWTTTGIGDFNGDGYDDMAITAPYENNRTGSLWIVYGNSGINNETDIDLDNPDGIISTRFDGENPGDFAGWSVSSIPLSSRPVDLIIGAPYHEGRGRTYLLHGGYHYGSQFYLNNITADLGYIIDGESLGDQFGYALNAISNLSGDGVPYVGIGAPGYSTARGRTYVIRYDQQLTFHFNLSTLQGSNGFVVDGENPGDYSGSSVLEGGDLRRNQNNNLIIGASGYNQSSGRIYVLYGISAFITPPFSDDPHKNNKKFWAFLTLSLLFLPLIYCIKKRNMRHQSCAEWMRNMGIFREVSYARRNQIAPSEMSHLPHSNIQSFGKSDHKKNRDGFNPFNNEDESTSYDYEDIVSDHESGEAKCCPCFKSNSD